MAHGRKETARLIEERTYTFEPEAEGADTFSYAGKTYQLTVSGKKKSDDIRETYTYDVNSNLTKTVDKNGNT